ncbi:MAG TPA: hypothetical protein VMQ61_09425 [Thermoanaerobaculia bacterium]|nr:hypothetical protein [Thermoanaerobaculia bacterium]
MRARAAAALPAILLLASACASTFHPVTAPDAARALDAWTRAIRDADLGKDANLLYDAVVSQGVASTRGTLAVRLRGERVEASLAGPFGAPLATYADGQLRGEKIASVAIAPRQLRALLAGVWSGEAPEVRGQRSGQALLVWSGSDAARGVLDLAQGRLVRLSVSGPQGEIEARYAGPWTPWPGAVVIDEKRLGSRLKLRLLSREPSA